MSSKGCFFTAFICAAILAFTLFAGVNIFYQADKNYRKKIDDNGQEITAIVLSKDKKRTKTTRFSYTYKGKEYSSTEAGRKLYNTSSPGDYIPIKIDTTAPQNAYVIGF